MKITTIILAAIICYNINDVISTDEPTKGLRISLNDAEKYETENATNIDIISILEDVLNVIIEQVIITIVKFRTFKRDINKVEKNVLAETALELDRITQGKIAQLNLMLTDDSSETKKDCITANGELIAGLTVIHNEDLLACTQDKMAKVADAEDRILKQLGNFAVVANDFYAEYNACSGEATCISKALNAALIKAVDVFFEIIWQVAYSQLVFPRTIADLKACGVSQIDSTVFEADAYLDECFKSAGIVHGTSYFLLAVIFASLFYKL